MQGKMKGPPTAPPVETQFAQKLAANDKKDRWSGRTGILDFDTLMISGFIYAEPGVLIFHCEL